jgi:hypothetical protein
MIINIAVLWDIKTLFVLHRRYITSPLQSPAGECYIRFEILTTVTMKNSAFWEIKTQFIPHKKHSFSATIRQLILCKICGFRGGDYEECRLKIYKNPVRT